MTAFTFTLNNNGIPEFVGRKKMVTGTYVSDGALTGGDIVTPLRLIEHVSLQPTGSGADASTPTVNETMPIASGTVTIVTIANGAGTFMILGE